MKLNILKKLAIAAAISTPFTANAATAGGNRGLFELLTDVKELIELGGATMYSVAMLLGIAMFIGGFIAVMAAGKTQDPNKTKSYGLVVVVIGIVLGSASAVMSMGSNTITGGDSEFSEFYDSYNQN